MFYSSPSLFAYMQSTVHLLSRPACLFSSSFPLLTSVCLHRLLNLAGNREILREHFRRCSLLLLKNHTRTTSRADDCLTSDQISPDIAETLPAVCRLYDLICPKQQLPLVYSHLSTTRLVQHQINRQIEMSCFSNHCLESRSRMNSIRVFADVPGYDRMAWDQRAITDYKGYALISISYSTGND